MHRAAFVSFLSDRANIRRRLSWGIPLAVVLTVFQTFCTRADVPEGQAQGQTRASIPAGWKAYQDPIGFNLALPPGWSARGDPSLGRVDLSGPGGAVLVVWPVFVENVQLQPATASLVAQRLTARLWPNVMWSGATPVGMNAVRLVGRRGDAALVSAFAWVNSPRGTAGTFYAATAPRDRYAELADTFSRILASFRAAGPPETQGSAPRPAPVRYVKWMDPRENAFAVEVPEGWRVAGGMFRAASNDTRVGVTADSPDNQISLQLGDPSLPVFIEPDQQMVAAGFYEGRWYTPVPGNNYLVRRYLPATYFLNEYVRTKMGSTCQKLEVDQPRDRSDAVQNINAMQAQLAGYGTYMQSTGAEISFTCERNGQPYRGYHFAVTQVTRMMSGGPANWSVSTQVGYLALASRAEQAAELSAHLLRSLTPNPQWLAMQQNITANTSRIITQTNAEISDMVWSGYEGRQRTQDEVARRQTNVNREQVDVVDTGTGEQLKIKSGANYYWMDYRGNIVGTDTATAPSIEFHELMKQP